MCRFRHNFSMSSSTQSGGALGAEVLVCKPKPVHEFQMAISRGPHDVPVVIAAINSVSAWLYPSLKTILLGGIPSVLTVTLLLQFGISNEHRKVVVVCVFALMLLASVTWMWILPRRDFLVLHERGFRWRIWLSAWRTWPNCGVIKFSELGDFAYCSDWAKPNSIRVSPLEPIAERLARVIAYMELDSHSLKLADAAGKPQVVENLFARFDQTDLNRFIDEVLQQRPDVVRKIER